MAKTLVVKRDPKDKPPVRIPGPRYKVTVAVKGKQDYELDFESLTGQPVNNNDFEDLDLDDGIAVIKLGLQEWVGNNPDSMSLFYELQEWGMIPDDFEVRLTVERLPDGA